MYELQLPSKNQNKAKQARTNPSLCVIRRAP